MAATMDLRFRNQTGQAFDEMVKDSQRVEDSLEDVRKESKRVEDAVDDMTGKGSKGMGDMSMKITGINQGFELLKKGAQAASQAIQALADNGNPAAQSLQSAFGEAKQALLDLGNDPAIRDGLQWLADTVSQDIVPFIRQIPDGIREIKDVTAGVVVAWGEWLGLLEDGTMEALHEEQAALREINNQLAEQIDLQNHINESKRQGKLAIDDIKAAHQAADDAFRAYTVSQIKDQDYLEKRIKDVESRYEGLAKDRALDGDKQKELQRELSLLIQRRTQLQIEGFQKEKAAAKEAADEQKALQQSIVDQQKKLNDEILNAEMQRAQQEIQIEQAKADKLKEILEGPQVQMAGNLRQGFGDQQVIDQITKQRTDEQRAKLEAEGMGGQDLERELRDFQRQQRRQVFRQAQRGNIDQGEEDEARNQLLLNLNDQVQKDKNLGAREKQAFEQAVKQNVEQAKVFQEQQQGVDNILKAVQDHVQTTAQAAAEIERQKQVIERLQQQIGEQGEQQRAAFAPNPQAQRNAMRNGSN